MNSDVNIRCYFLLALSLHALLGAANLTAASPTTNPGTGSIEFNRDIRPILADKCFACHGPDNNRREADLRLDTEQGLLGNGTDKPGVVVPRDLAASELIRRIESADADERMPPAEFGKALDDGEIRLLRQWVESGATWQGHWSLEPIRSSPPWTEQGDRPPADHPIDSFVQKELATRGLTAAPEADRRTLIRRLSLDLTGLPPQPHVVEQYLADTAPDAYERLVDHYLSSHPYGERMAIWWLDLVRYADTVGYHGDQDVTVYPFREYVIRSFLENKPFDQFTIEQLAGDLLPHPTLSQKIASGYCRLGMMSAEGGVQDKEYLAKYIAERVRNLGGTWLGMTLGCCECHNHKYDPFTMKEFYSLEAFFADIKERGLYSGANSDGNWGPRVQVPTSEQSRQLAAIDQSLAAIRARLDQSSPELQAAEMEWEKGRVPWIPLNPLSAVSSQGATLTVQDNGSVLASGPSPEKDVYTLTFRSPLPRITALRLEVLPHASLPKQGPGRADNGNFVLTEWKVAWQAEAGATGPAEIGVSLRNPSATYEQTGGAEKSPYGKWPLLAAIDADAQGTNWGWAILERAGQTHHAVVELEDQPADRTDQVISVQLLHQHDGPRHTLGHFRISATDQTHPVRTGDVASEEIEKILRIPRHQRSVETSEHLSSYYRQIAPLLEPLREQLKQIEARRAELDRSIATTLVTEAVEPRMIRVLARGNWMDESGDIVQPGFPDCLSQFSASTGATARRLNRLDLAHWLMDPQHPLTARVFVNRVWKLFFGAGISRKLDDLGSQGDWPSHPELLDWLAADFRDSGWNVKRLVKQILMSSTYRQSSRLPGSAADVDPSNRWLARQARFRLDAEFVRDNGLAISGLLVDRVGGPSAKPYQPAGYWAYLNFPTREWQNSQGADLYRRGIYIHWQRQYLYPPLMSFDAPSREECTADRPRSNTPLQALVLLNDPAYVEVARAFATRVIREGGTTPTERIDWAMRQAVTRPARSAEIETLERLWESHLTQFQQDPQAAEKFLAVGDHPIPPGLQPAELAAWTSVTRVILNLHETVNRN